MSVYTFSEARQNFASPLEKAKTERKVLIRRKDGSVFTIQPVLQKDSPLDVKGFDADVNASEIVSILRELRER